MTGEVTLRDLRRKSGIALGDMATRMGISKNTVMVLERKSLEHGHIDGLRRYVEDGLGWTLLICVATPEDVLLLDDPLRRAAEVDC
jgi:transcriptional regulator with XRE-family HTH domain